MQKSNEAIQRPKKSKAAQKKNRMKLRKSYKKFISRVKKYRGVTSLLISVRGQVYDTSLEHEEVSEYINYKFGSMAQRARRDIRDIDPLEDIKCIRISTLFYEAVIGLGGKPDKEYMIFVTQKTPDSIQRPAKKPKITGVYIKETDPMKEQQEPRKNPVKSLQKKLFGITADAAIHQQQVQEFNETRALKLAQIERAQKHKTRIANLTELTKGAIEAVTPVIPKISTAGQWREKLTEVKEPKPDIIALPDLPTREALFDLGYYRPRASRRISIYDDEGYKLRGDVKIGFKPQEDDGMFPSKKSVRTQFRTRGVFQRQRYSEEDEAEKHKEEEEEQKEPTPIPATSRHESNAEP